MKILKLNLSNITISQLSNQLILNNKISVAVCNVNTLVSVDKDKLLEHIFSSFTFRVPDGMPLVWMMKKKGQSEQERLNGMKILKNTIEAGLSKQTKHCFIGTTDFILTKLKQQLLLLYPDINIGGLLAPPFGSQKEIEDFVDSNINEILDSDILWIGLGMPKQELLMKYLGKHETNLVGVGAVFEWIAGTKKNAPQFFQNNGLEWLYRLVKEPKRLWKRYLFDFLYIIKILFFKVLKLSD